MDATSGWNRVGVTLTYASATTFTVPGDYTTLFGSPGVRIRFTQGGVIKYFYCIAASYSAPNTTVTVTPGVDSTGAMATVANSEITLPYFSRRETPEGFPEWIPYTPTWSCSSGAAPDKGDGTLVASFKLNGKDCRFKLCLTFGSSTTGGDGGNWRFTLPFAVQDISSQGPPNNYMMAHARDVSSPSASYPLQAQINYSVSSTLLTLLAGMTAGTNVNYCTYNVPFTWSGAAGALDNLSVDGWYRWAL